jgi:hypothetical protein
MHRFLGKPQPAYREKECSDSLCPAREPGLTGGLVNRQRPCPQGPQKERTPGKFQTGAQTRKERRR